MSFNTLIHMRLFYSPATMYFLTNNFKTHILSLRYLSNRFFKSYMYFSFSFNCRCILLFNFNPLSAVHMSNLFQKFRNGILKNSSFKIP